MAFGRGHRALPSRHEPGAVERGCAVAERRDRVGGIGRDVGQRAAAATRRFMSAATWVGRSSARLAPIAASSAGAIASGPARSIANRAADSA